MTNQERGGPQVKAMVTDKIFRRSMETLAVPGIALLITRSLGDLGRGPGQPGSTHGAQGSSYSSASMEEFCIINQ